MSNYDKLESSVRDTLGSVAWSHKIHEKQADIYDTRYRRMETAKIAAASLTSVGIISMIFTDQLWIKLVSALISFVSVFVSAFFKSFNLQVMVSRHKSSATKLLVIRDNLKLLILQMHMQKDDPNTIYDKYESTVHQLDRIYADAPNTTDKAVEKARDALNITQDNTFSDMEINSMLPARLRTRGEK
jgi:hypothetical protein